MEILGHLDFLAQRGILETVGTRDHQVFWQLHLFRLKVLGGILGSQDAMERWGMLDPLAPPALQVDQGMTVQA